MELAVDGKGQIVSKIPPGNWTPGGYGGLPPDERPSAGAQGATGTADGTPAASSVGTAASGTGDDGSTPSTGPSDWSSVLGIYGLPPDVMSKIDQIFSSTSDVSQATALALAYVRGTDWYKTTYPGIAAGLQNGTVSNESDYRSYVNSIDQLYQQYYGRNPTSDEVSNYLTSGYNPSYVGKLFQGQAYVQANKPEIQYTTGNFAPGQGQMSSSQLTALGNEQAGIDSPLGQLQQKIYNKAQQIQNKIQTGSFATPSLSLGSQGLSSPSMAGAKQTPDIGAT